MRCGLACGPMWNEMPLPSEAGRDRRLYVQDMLEFCERAMHYADGFSLDQLLQDTMRYDAILRNVELIGEAATRLGPAERALAPSPCPGARSSARATVWRMATWASRRRRCGTS